MDSTQRWRAIWIFPQVAKPRTPFSWWHDAILMKHGFWYGLVCTTLVTRHCWLRVAPSHVNQKGEKEVSHMSQTKETTIQHNTMTEPKPKSVAGGITNEAPPVDPSGAFVGAREPMNNDHPEPLSTNEGGVQRTDNPPVEDHRKRVSFDSEATVKSEVLRQQDKQHHASEKNSNSFIQNHQRNTTKDDREEIDDDSDDELLAAVAALSAREDTLTRELSRVVDPSTLEVVSQQQNDKNSTQMDSNKTDDVGSDDEKHFGPFAQRAGHTLSWTNVNMEVKTKTGKRTVVKDLEGLVLPGQLTAIMGHSGAGKSTLLNILSGKIRPNGNISVGHDIRLDGQEVVPTAMNVRRKIAFVPQHDVLLMSVTPREAFAFSAQLRLPKEETEDTRTALTNSLLKELALDHVADSFIRNLSGGEMRRVSLGIELVVRPSIVLLDEVTSGLDSFNAMKVMRVLKKVAMCGASVVSTIHQPNSQIFESIDHLFLIHHGECMYQGPVKELPGYFAERGYEVPPSYNPADWMLMVSESSTTEELKARGFFRGGPTAGTTNTATMSKSNARSRKSAAARAQQLGLINSRLVEKAGGSSRNLAPLSKIRRSLGGGAKKKLSIFETLEGKNRIGFMDELMVLMRRRWTMTLRDRGAVMYRFIVVIVLGVFASVSFSGVGGDSLDSIEGFRGHIGAIFFFTMSVMIEVQSVLIQFVGERPVFIREYTTDHYRFVTYAIDRFIYDIVFGIAQIAVYYTPAHFILDLRGRYWYIFICLYIYGLVQNSIGLAAGSAVKHVEDARSLVFIFMTPQALFCGYFVAIEEMPAALRWLQYVTPLNYVFRLVLAEEFSFCADNSEAIGADLTPSIRGSQNMNATDIEGLLRCTSKLSNSGFKVPNADPNLFNDSSTLDVARVGAFPGVDGITEYLNLISDDTSDTSGSLFQSYCPLAGQSELLEYSISNDGDHCDVTIGYGARLEVNPSISNLEGGNELLDFMSASRIVFDILDDDSVHVSRTHFFFSRFMMDLLPEILVQTKIVNRICSVMETDCSSVFAENGFDDPNEPSCAEKMSTLPLLTEGSDGGMHLDGNSTACRGVHMFLATDNTDHCPHISFKPIEDKDGKIKCSQSADLDQFTYFSDRTARGLSLLSARYELATGGYTLPRIVNISATPKKENGILDCSEGLFDDLTRGVDPSILEDLDGQFSCSSYLATQQSTGAENAVYWSMLVGMIVLGRTLGLYFLRRKAMQNSSR